MCFRFPEEGRLRFFFFRGRVVLFVKRAEERVFLSVRSGLGGRGGVTADIRVVCGRPYTAFEARAPPGLATELCAAVGRDLCGWRLVVCFVFTAVG